MRNDWPARVSVAAAVLVLAIASPAYPQTRHKGEIVNVNYEYRIAFTDLGTGELTTGDIVEVRLKNGRALSLQVIETSDVLSKLALFSAESGKQNEELFRGIGVGDAVVKVGRGPVPDDKTTALLRQMTPAEDKPSASIRAVPAGPARGNAEITSPEQIDLSNELEQLRMNLQDIRNEKQLLSQQVRDLKTELEQKNARIGELTSLQDRLTGEKTEQEQQLEQLRRSEADLKNRIAALETIMAKLNTRLTRMSELISQKK